GVLYFDLDGFKVVNDSFGHGAGDALLVQIGTRLQEDLRAGAVLARLSGDEFAVMIEDITEPEAVAAANRMANALAIPVDVHGRPITMTVSVGVALSDGSIDSGTDLLRDADLAMYRAKEEGRNRIEVFDASMRAVVDREAAELQEFRQALLGGAIVAWYQPEVDLVTGHTVECEALARWEHPTRGMLPAGAFIDMAYATGLADDVTAAVAASSLRFLRDSCADLPPDFRLRINLTPRSVGSANNTHRFLASVRAHGISPALLTVEVTEQAVIRDIDSATTNLETLRDAGIRVSLDDFGTGYSSLSLLRKLPFDSIKMDRSFVGGMLTNAADLAIVRTTIDLARQLEMEVVAEGVENREQAELLLSLGCVRAQGYLYAPALSPERFMERVRNEREAIATYGAAAVTLEPATKAGAA
ncbi:MAG: putative bifunctional diguanylate cyclase/phosphodiesterase, partial [Acidimicrobiia bacterium]